MRWLLLLLLLCSVHGLWAHGPAVSFTENKGQWPTQVLYRANVPGGAVFVEREALTIVQFSGIDLHAHGEGSNNATPRGHAYRIHFVNGQAQAYQGEAAQPHYENFYLGNDPTKWGAGCAVYAAVLLKDVWPGIDLRIDGEQAFKYDLLVAPGADASRARFRYEGQDGLHMRGKELHVELSTGIVVEEPPVVFTLNENGIREPVAAHYEVCNELVRVAMPKGYDNTRVLVIDPVLTFASYSGSTADNFGFTATYDDAGHTYGGGVVFGAGYPITTGAFDPTYNGGSADVGISKWTPSGNALVWSTFIGGSDGDAPHSLVTNADQELFIMGSTGSPNFPTTAGCFQSSFQGGSLTSFQAGYGFSFNNGTDIFVTHLNANGTALLGSTYVGGSQNDGVNVSAVTYNYGDPFRGEIALDPDGNPVICTNTASSNMPVSAGATQSTYGGGNRDGYVFRMSTDMSTMLWGTYHGGSGADIGHGVQFSSTGDVYITGGTNSTDLPVAGAVLQPSSAGGVDGFIARYSPDGSVLLSSTYLGTNAYDQCFFIQLDTQDDVYVVGQTRGNYPITPGIYSNPGSSQFIHKMSSDLGTTIWTTRIGNGNATQDMSPAAFLVSDCGQIYFSGWAGSTNNLGQPTASTSNGMPITPDAFQSTTDGSDFYLMVLQSDAAALSYGTYFGGTGAEHVDGGTSRFDKNGKVYQAVCAGCGGGTFPTTPGSHSTTNNASNCNLGVFKFDLNIPIASIDIEGPGVICFPETVQFVNNSTGGNTFHWDFGDGGTSSDFAPTHTYTSAGEFSVSMVMTDNFGCTQADTASIMITSVTTDPAFIDPIPTICPGASVQLNASEGDTWEWFPATGLSSTTVQNPIASPDTNTTYFVIVTNACGVDTAQVDVVIAPSSGSVLPDAAICLGGSTTLGASGGVEFTWTPATGLSDPTIAAPVASPTDTTTYSVSIITPEGCEIIDSVTVNVVFTPPLAILTDTAICLGGSAHFTAVDADSYAWNSVAGISDPSAQTQTVGPASSTWVVVTASNLCGSSADSAFVEVVEIIAQAWRDTLICPGNPVQLLASGGTEYSWSPAVGLDNTSIMDPTATTFEPITYTVVVSNAMGCNDTASLTIGLLPPPTVNAGPDRIIDFWDQIALSAIASEEGSFQWTPWEGLSCDTCANTYALPSQSMEYTVTFTADNTCTATDKVLVIINGSLFVPNTFTPNGDAMNDEFGVWGSELAEVHLQVFNRWGELIFESDAMDKRWDGRYKGVPSPIDTYVWKVSATEISGLKREAIGHVNLVR